MHTPRPRRRRDRIAQRAAALARRHQRRALRYIALAVALFGLAALVFVLGLAGLFTFAFKSSDAYRASAAYVREHPEVIAELGAPVRVGGLPSGKIERTGDFGSSQLSFDLTGTRASARAHVQAKRGGTEWVVTEAKVVVGDRVLVLAPRPETAAVGAP